MVSDRECPSAAARDVPALGGGPACSSGGGVEEGGPAALDPDPALDPLGSPQAPLASPRLELAPEFGAAAWPPAPAPRAATPAADAAPEPLLRSRPPSLSTLVPLDAAGGASSSGGSAAADEEAAVEGGRAAPLGAAPMSDDEHDDSSLGMESSRGGQERLEAGYESSDDMDCMNARHCINCTGDLWGSVCQACGYMDGHEASIFDPLVASPPRAALLRAAGTTVISYDERMLLHDENLLPLHPERADRIRAVMARLDAAQLTGHCRRLPSREATPQEVERCHVPELMSVINVLSERSRLQGNETLHWPTSDTYVNQHTALCARLSAGACVDVAVAVARGEAASGVAVVRPPGHHAESNTAMGFCFFNNAGIAARAAQAAGAGRVIILDWDVHHGNGTQHIFEADPSVMYMSLHRYDGGQFYPGTGAVTEVGLAGAEGYTVNVPWPCGNMRNGDYMAAFQHLLVPIAHEFAPDLVIISAGFDAAEGDPIGGCNLTPEVYAHMTAMLQNVAPTVLLLEGGYNLTSVAKATEACVRVLLGDRPPPLPAHQPASDAGMSAVAVAMRVQARYWRCCRQLLARLAPPAAQALALHAGGQQAQHGGGGREEADEDTDTPHVDHARGGAQFGPVSGWESDGGSLGDSKSPLAGGAASGAAALQRAGSDTALGSEGGEDGEDGQGEDLGDAASSGPEEEEEVQLLQGFHASGSGGLPSPTLRAAAALDASSADLLPREHSGTVPTPQLPSSLALSGSPSGLECAAEEGRGSGNSEQQQQQQASTEAGAAAGGGGLDEDEVEDAAPHGSAAAANWRSLALKVVAMKRSGSGHRAPRLSPQLLREALASQLRPATG